MPSLDQQISITLTVDEWATVTAAVVRAFPDSGIAPKITAAMLA